MISKPRFQSRRSFLFTTALATAGIAAGVPKLFALTPQISRIPASTFFPEGVDEAVLQSVATSAMDAARAVGAQFADIRIGQWQSVSMSTLGGRPLPLRVESQFGYGVRALVNGAWGFVYGIVPTRESVIATTQAAVARARGNAAINKQYGHEPETVSPAPVVTGSWETPVEIPPLTIPLDDYYQSVIAWTSSIARRATVSAVAAIHIRVETRVLASTEGSLITQRLTRTSPGYSVWNLPVPLVACSTSGAEVVFDRRHEERVEKFANALLPLVSQPEKTMDIGRYPMVISSGAMGQMLGEVVCPALELDRVLGEEADASGTSYLESLIDPSVNTATPAVTPTSTFSQQFTLRSDPTGSVTPSPRWDADGVVPEPITLIDKGRVVDFLSTRATAPALATWYAQQSLDNNGNTRSNGSAYISTCDRAPVCAGHHFTVEPSPVSSSLQDMIRSIKRGVFVFAGTRVKSSTTLTTCELGRTGSGSGGLFEIRNGRIISRLASDNAILFKTSKLLTAGLVSLGDAGTEEMHYFDGSKGIPWRPVQSTIRTPAALFKDADLVVSLR